MIKIQKDYERISTDEIIYLRVEFSHDDKNAILLTQISENLYNDRPTLDKVILLAN